MAKKRRDLPFEKRKHYFQANFKSVKSADINVSEEGVLIEGYANTVDLDRGNDVVEARAFEDSIAKDYKNNPIILFQHDHYRGIGRATELRITERGLYVKALIFDEEIKKMIENGVYRTFSIGYSVEEEKYYSGNGDLLDPTNSADLQRIYYEEGVKRVITKLELYEISVVSVPMNATSIFDLSKSITSYFDEKINHLKSKIMDEVKIINELKSVEETEEVASGEEPEQTEEKPDETAEKADELKNEPSEADEPKTEETGENPEASQEPKEDQDAETVVEVEDVETVVEDGEGEEVEAEPEEDEEKSIFGVKKEMLTLENLNLAIKTVADLRAEKAKLEAELKSAKEIIAKTGVKKARINVSEFKQFDGQGSEETPEPQEGKKGFVSLLSNLAKKNL